MKVEKLLNCIGGIDDFFIHEAEAADYIEVKIARRKRIVKYSVTGLAVSAVSVGLALALRKFVPGVGVRKVA